jgi:hypothetical protein
MAIDLGKLSESQVAPARLRIELVDSPGKRKRCSHNLRAGFELPEIVEEAFSDCLVLLGFNVNLF